MASPPLRQIRVSRIALFAAIVTSWFALAALSQTAQPAASPPRQPILVELFTSEGCSDCPPADALLAQLDTRQSVPGVEAIVLSEHVTYWNHLGWRDPFSLDLVDERQQQYKREFFLDDVYTPQMVIDGAEQFVGSDTAKLQAALEKEAAKPKLEIKIENPQIAANGAVSFTVHLPPGAKGTLVAAVAENATQSEVARGENAGRTLHHVAVVRVMKEFSANSAASGKPLSLSGADLVSAEKTSTPLRLVVFLVNGGSGHVMGAAEQTLQP